MYHGRFVHENILDHQEMQIPELLLRVVQVRLAEERVFAGDG